VGLERQRNGSDGSYAKSKRSGSSPTRPSRYKMHPPIQPPGCKIQDRPATPTDSSPQIPGRVGGLAPWTLHLVSGWAGASCVWVGGREAAVE
jgi:hypothetical protein